MDIGYQGNVNPLLYTLHGIMRSTQLERDPLFFFFFLPPVEIPRTHSKNVSLSQVTRHTKKKKDFSLKNKIKGVMVLDIVEDGFFD